MQRTPQTINIGLRTLYTMLRVCRLIALAVILHIFAMIAGIAFGIVGFLLLNEGFSGLFNAIKSGARSVVRSMFQWSANLARKEFWLRAAQLGIKAVVMPLQFSAKIVDFVIDQARMIPNRLLGFALRPFRRWYTPDSPLAFLVNFAIGFLLPVLECAILVVPIAKYIPVVGPIWVLSSFVGLFPGPISMLFERDRRFILNQAFGANLEISEFRPVLTLTNALLYSVAFAIELPFKSAHFLFLKILGRSTREEYWTPAIVRLYEHNFDFTANAVAAQQRAMQEFALRQMAAAQRHNQQGSFAQAQLQAEYNINQGGFAINRFGQALRCAINSNDFGQVWNYLRPQARSRRESLIDVLHLPASDLLQGHNFTYERFWGNLNAEQIEAIEATHPEFVSVLGTRMVVPVYVEKSNGGRTYFDLIELLRLFYDAGGQAPQNPETREPIRSLQDIHFDKDLYMHIRHAINARSSNALPADNFDEALDQTINKESFSIMKNFLQESLGSARSMGPLYHFPDFLMAEINQSPYNEANYWAQKNLTRPQLEKIERAFPQYLCSMSQTLMRVPVYLKLDNDKRYYCDLFQLLMYMRYNGKHPIYDRRLSLADIYFDAQMYAKLQEPRPLLEAARAQSRPGAQEFLRAFAKRQSHTKNEANLSADSVTRQGPPTEAAQPRSPQ